MFISVVEMFVGLWNWCRRFGRNVSARNVSTNHRLPPKLVKNFKTTFCIPFASSTLTWPSKSTLNVFALITLPQLWNSTKNPVFIVELFCLMLIKNQIHSFFTRTWTFSQNPYLRTWNGQNVLTKNIRSIYVLCLKHLVHLELVKYAFC